MKIIINEDTVNPLEVIEYLEPTGTYYSIKRNGNTINFENRYEMDELHKVLKFLLKKYEE